MSAHVRGRVKEAAFLEDASRRARPAMWPRASLLFSAATGRRVSSQQEQKLAARVGSDWRLVCRLAIAKILKVPEPGFPVYNENNDTRASSRSSCSLSGVQVRSSPERYVEIRSWKDVDLDTPHWISRLAVRESSRLYPASWQWERKGQDIRPERNLIWSGRFLLHVRRAGAWRARFHPGDRHRATHEWSQDSLGQDERRS